MLGFIQSTSSRLLTRTVSTPLVCHAHARPRTTPASRRSHATPTSSDAAVMREETDPGAVEGTQLRVLKYPHPLLRAENAAVQDAEFGDALRQTAREMLKVMYASSGVGLAAPQVGINKRIMVFNPEGSSKAFLQEVVLVNPTIVGSSNKTDVEREACLSFPGLSGRVRRHEWVKVEAMRLNGKKVKVKYEGWKARIFQHEYDHLQGVVYIDRLEEQDDVNDVRARLDELIDEYSKQPYKGQGAAL